MKKILLVSFSILFFRLADLISTHYALLNQKNLDNEMNLIVKIFKLKNKNTFYALEVFFAFLLIAYYIYSYKRKNLFYKKADSFSNYLKLLFFSKKEITFFDFFIKMSFKKTFICIGNIVPQFIILSSSLYILNNYLVYKVNKHSNFRNSLYYKINKIIDIQALIYTLPIIILILLTLQFLFKQYKIYNR